MNSVFLCGDEWLVQRVIVCSVNHSWQFFLHELLHILMLCITMVLINHLLDRVGGLHFSGFYFVFEKLNILAWLYCYTQQNLAVVGRKKGRLEVM